MGLDISDACLVKEPDGVITYRNDTHTRLNRCTNQDKCEDKLNSRSSSGNKLKNMLKHVSTTSDVSPRAKFTIPQPFALATERRASCGARTLSSESDGCADVDKLSVKFKEIQSPRITKRNQLLSLFISRKPTHAQNKKHPHDDGDDGDVTSLATAKPKITVASAPTFRSTERAEKRKEFNSKLEEKHQALEAEKLESEERTKEEREAAIKQLRKSMMFKASPMPNFYQSPPKVQVKKPAPACAKSPKFGRRKSCSDADGLNNLKKDAQRGSCHDLVISNMTKSN